MAIIIDPGDPEDGDNPRLGAGDIRGLTTQLLQLLGFPGNVAVTFTLPPITNVNLVNGAPTLAAGALLTADPTVALGAATKQYVDNAVSVSGPTIFSSGVGAFVTNVSVPYYTCMLVGGGGGGSGGGGGAIGSGGGGGAVTLVLLQGGGLTWAYTVGPGGAAQTAGGFTAIGGGNITAAPGAGATMTGPGAGGAAFPSLGISGNSAWVILAAAGGPGIIFGGATGGGSSFTAGFGGGGGPASGGPGLSGSNGLVLFSAGI